MSKKNTTNGSFMVNSDGFTYWEPKGV